MRLSSSSSSSSPSAGLHSLLKKNPLASTVLLVCFSLLPLLVAGAEETEIALKTANHGQDQARVVSMDAKYARIATSSRHHDLAHSRKNKPNKSSFKKYIEDSSSVDQHGKEKKSIYDKKYFDYMPVQLKGPLDVPTDVSLAKRTNSRRLRRDAGGAEQRTKRQGPWPSYSVSGYSYQVPMIYPGSVFVQFDPNNNYRPNLNNHYLPPVTFTPVPQQPDRTYLPTVTQRPQPTEPPGRPTTTVPVPPRTTSPATRLTTTTPRPVIQHNSDDDFDWSTLGLSPDGDGGSSVNDNTLNSARKEPSKCTWAIANCCSQFSDKIRYYCFEQNQCFGAFWGDNVCRGYYRLALAEIEKYYNV